MRRAVLVGMAAVVFLGAKGCGERDCEKLKAAVVAACAVSEEACERAKAMVEENCQPTPEPTPATCADGFPPGPNGCPKTCADLACKPCEETASGPVCRPTEPTPPPVVACAQPDVPDDAWTVVVPEPPAENVRLIGEAMAEFARRYPSRVTADGSGLAGFTEANGHDLAERYIEDVATILNGWGLCALRTVDALTVKASSGWQEFHVVYYGRGTFIQPAHAYRNTWVVKGDDVVSAECPAPRPDLDPTKLKIALKPHGRWLDATMVTIGTCGYCEAIGMGELAPGVPRCGCPMRPDGHAERVACEAYASRGGTVWETSPRGKTVELNDGNPWQARCVECERMRVCTKDGAVCSAWVDVP